MDNIAQIIKKHIEVIYDIPFVVKNGQEYNDPYYLISPKNELEELFMIKLTLRQEIRMIIEIQPQKYAAEMLKDMQAANLQKKHNFCEYIQMLRNKNAKIDLYINGALCDAANEQIWMQHWKQFRIRATKILSECESNSINVIMFWAEHSVGLILSLLNVEQLDTEEYQYKEGNVSQVLVNKYERNPINRQLCLAANGYICKICGFDFALVYGEIGEQFIHVHHIQKVSSFGGEYYLNPKTDLIPVCPNCHAMLHKVDPPMLPEQLYKIIQFNKTKQGDCK